MLRHACGYALVNKGHGTRTLQAYLGHRSIQRSARYVGAVAKAVEIFLASIAQPAVGDGLASPRPRYRFSMPISRFFISQNMPKPDLPPSSPKFNFATSKKAGRNPTPTVSASGLSLLFRPFFDKEGNIRAD